MEGSYWSVPLAFPSAAGWLVSTIADYWTFVQMMLNRGVHQGVPLISEASVELMTTDHLTRRQRESGFPILGENEGCGLGLMTPAADAEGRGVPSGYGCNGGTGTTWAQTSTGISAAWRYRHRHFRCRVWSGT